MSRDIFFLHLISLRNVSGKKTFQLEYKIVIYAEKNKISKLQQFLNGRLEEFIYFSIPLE